MGEYESVVWELVWLGRVSKMTFTVRLDTQKFGVVGGWVSDVADHEQWSRGHVSAHRIDGRFVSTHYLFANMINMK